MFGRVADRKDHELVEHAYGDDQRLIRDQGLPLFKFLGINVMGLLTKLVPGQHRAVEPQREEVVPGDHFALQSLSQGRGVGCQCVLEGPFYDAQLGNCPLPVADPKADQAVGNLQLILVRLDKLANSPCNQRGIGFTSDRDFDLRGAVHGV